MEQEALSELEVFIPGPGENAQDPGDHERTTFLETAQELLDSGLDIAVYSTDSYPSAFEDCVPVADILEIAGRDALPILLADGALKVSYNYPDAEQLKRFSTARTVKQKKVSAAAAACGTGGQDAPVLSTNEPAGFAATLAGVQEKPAGGPAIGNRTNLMSIDKSIESSGGATTADSCGCGGCGCGAT